MAQIATGWEAINDGPVLLQEPLVGSYTIDLVRNVSIVNGRETKLGMMTVLNIWLDEELQRLKRSRDWVTKATVDVAYQLVPSDTIMRSIPGYWTTEAFSALLSATVSVATSDGTAEASLKNYQAVAGKMANPIPPPPHGA